jgi:hypothetical protein
MKSRISFTGALLIIIFCFFPAIAGAGPSIDDLLPPASAAAGWKPAGQPYQYTPENLYQYINGAADLFISYGFIKLSGSEYIAVSGSQESLTVDIYDMKNKLNAFGVFQSKRDPDSMSLNIGAGAFGSEQYLYFYKARFYVEIQAYLTGGRDKKVLADLARSIAEKIQGNSTPPAELRYLPASGLVPGSEKYITGGILGHAFLDKGLMGDYRVGQDVVKAFVAFFPSPAGAAAAMSAYNDFLQKAGKKQLDLNGFGEAGFVSEEPYHKQLLVAQQGAFVAGVTDLNSVPAGIRLLQRVMEGIKKPL